MALWIWTQNWTKTLTNSSKSFCIVILPILKNVGACLSVEPCRIPLQNLTKLELNHLIFYRYRNFLDYENFLRIFERRSFRKLVTRQVNRGYRLYTTTIVCSVQSTIVHPLPNDIDFCQVPSLTIWSMWSFVDWTIFPTLVWVGCVTPWRWISIWSGAEIMRTW